MNDDIRLNAIFSPGELAVELSEELQKLGHEVTLFSPGKIKTKVKNITGDLSLIDHELKLRGYGYMELLTKHPLLFTNLARQVQSELIKKAYQMANDGEFDIVHIYMNEEEIAMTFADFCKVPTVFNHHEPFNFLAKYRSIFPKYKKLNWISISYAQRNSMPKDTNWVGNVYHGILPLDKGGLGGISQRNFSKGEVYFAFFGRIIEPKGLHLAIEACRKAKVKLKIAGKHYSDESKDKYWEEIIKPQIDGEMIEYVGFLKSEKEKVEFLANAKALLMPSTWEEPFGMVMIESLRVGTPIIGLNNGAIPEVIDEGVTGFVVNDPKDLVTSIAKIDQIDRNKCVQIFKKRFSLERMAKDYEKIYQNL